MTHATPRSVRNDLQWRCPHCLGKGKFLPSAMDHVKADHGDCWSCRVEWMLMDAIWNGVGESWFSRAREGPFDSRS